MAEQESKSPCKSDTKNLWLIVITAIIATFFLILTQKWVLHEPNEQPVITPPQEFPDFQPSPESKSIMLYDDFVFEEIINTPNIIKNSRIIQTYGEIGSGKLVVNAEARTDWCWDTARIHSIYFYVDDGSTGGHLGAVKKDARIISGGFTNKQSPYKEEFDMSIVPISKEVNGSTTLDLIKILGEYLFMYSGIKGSDVV